MEFTRKVHEQYQKAYAMASSCQQKNKKHGLPISPVVLDNMLNERMIYDRQDLGVMDIPTDLIEGLAESSDEMLLYTKEFLPVSLPSSAEAEQWCRVCSRFLQDQQETEPILCLEYLGKFYVSEGLILVSVAKFAEIPQIRSRVIRIMPIEADSREVAQYYDFLTHYQLTDLYQMQFTQPGFFEEMEKAFGKSRGERWSDLDRAAFLRIWPKIVTAFKRSYPDCLSITTADAFVVLLRKYSYRQLILMDTWVLARIFQASWKDLYSLSGADIQAPSKKARSNALQTA